MCWAETLTEVEALGCLLVLSFVVVASIETSGSDHASRTGIGLSLVACVGFGLYLFLLVGVAGVLVGMVVLSLG